METNELLIGLNNKNKEAFSVLYDNYSAALFGVTLRMVKNKTIAEEILQDVFLKIWKNSATYDETKGTLFTWMINIARNSCKDYFRCKQYRYEQHIVEDEIESMVYKYIPQATTPDDESKHLQSLLNNLEPKYKDVIEMVYVYGYTQVEVAKQLELPLGTVKTRSREALKQLRCCYLL